MNSVKKTAWLGAAAAVTCVWLQSATALDLYAGANYLLMESSVERSVSTDGPRNAIVRPNADGSAMSAHVGLWLNEGFAIEFRGGFAGDSAEFDGDGSGYSGHTAELNDYFGVYLVPHAQLFDWMVVAFPMGLTQLTVTMPDETDDSTTNGPDSLEELEGQSLSYGLDIRWGVGTFLADPDSTLGSLSINTGFMVYSTDEDLRATGANLGIQIGWAF